MFLSAKVIQLSFCLQEDIKFDRILWLDILGQVHQRRNQAMEWMSCWLSMLRICKATWKLSITGLVWPHILNTMLTWIHTRARMLTHTHT